MGDYWSNSSSVIGYETCWGLLLRGVIYPIGYNLGEKLGSLTFSMSSTRGSLSTEVGAIVNGFW
jgi:hypothetical protein